MAPMTDPDQKRYILLAAAHIRRKKGDMTEDQKEELRRCLFDGDKRDWTEALKRLDASRDEEKLRAEARKLRRDSWRHAGEGAGSGYWGRFSKTHHLMGWLLHHGRCVYCDRDLVGEGYIRDGRATSDHLIPWASWAEGDKDYMNIVPACIDCNAAKGNMDPRLE